MTGRRVKVREQRKTRVGIETTLEYCEQRILEYIRKCRESGIEVPPLPRFQGL